MVKSLVPDIDDEISERTPLHFFPCPKCGSTDHLIIESIHVDTFNGSVECCPDEIIKTSNLENLLNPDEMIVSIRYLCHVCNHATSYRLKSEDKSVQVDFKSISQHALDDMDNVR